MQIWIYFQPGVGGDGFANLLEQSGSVTKYDGFQYQWRIHRRVDNQTKFFAPAIDKNHCFRSTVSKFDNSNNNLHQSYIDCVLNNKTIICTSHDIPMKFFKKHDSQEILTKDLVKVLVTCQDYKSAWIRAAIKGLYTGSVDAIFCEKIKVDLSHFDHVLEIEKIQSDWNYVKTFCQTLGLELNESSYQDYQDILAGSTKFDQPGIEIYQSNIVNGIISYTKIN